MILGFDDFELDPNKPELRRAGRPVKADAIVLRLLVELVRDAGRLVTKQALLTRVWQGRSVSENVITVAMARLRRTLGQADGAPAFVDNVHGQGYRFARPVIARDAQLEPAPAGGVDSASAPPLVGRDRALDRLRSALEAARAGRGGLCVVTGEPGIGKTRLIEAFASEARELGVALAWGYCHEAGEAPPLWPFAQLLRELLAQTSLRASDPRLSSALPELARLLPELGAQANLDVSVAPFEYEPAGQHRMFDAITRALTCVAAPNACVVLVLDDLHRADATSVQLLRYFVDEIARTRVLLLATLRSEALSGAAKPQLRALLGHRNCTRVALERLRETDVAAYVGALLDDASGELARAVFKKSEGNPFFMAELSRQLLDSDRRDGLALSVPDAALELLRQRMAALDDATRGVLSCAAVMGRSFELSVLQVAVDRDGAALMASLDEALASDVLVAAPDSKTAFAFGHELFRDALYDALLPGERRSWHLRVARALAQREDAGGAVAPAELAHHFFSALPETDLKRTVRACAQAATACAEVYAYEDAGRYLRHAREALGLLDKPSRRLHIDLLLRQALYARVDSSAEFVPLVREAIDSARKLQAGVPLALAALMLDLHPGFPPLPGARAALEDALSLLRPEDAMRSAVLARLATSPPLAFDAERSAAQVAHALELGLASDLVLGIYTARSAQLFLLGGPAQETTAALLLHELETLCRKHATILNVAPLWLELHRAITACQRGDREAVQAALASCQLRGRRVRSRELLWHAERFGVLARIGARDARSPHTGSDEDLTALRALHARAVEQSLIGARVLCAFDQCVVLRAPVTDELRATLAFDANDPPNVWALKLRALAAAGLHEEVRSGLRSVPPQRLALLPCDRDYLGTLGALARATLAVGALEYAAPLRALLAPYADRFAVNVSFVSDGSVAELLADLA